MSKPTELHLKVINDDGIRHIKGSFNIKDANVIELGLLLSQIEVTKLSIINRINELNIYTNKLSKSVEFEDTEKF